MFKNWALACGMVGVLFAASPASAIDLNEECIASILNRSVQVNPDGTFALPNVPVPLGAFRVRVVCDRGNGTVEIGQSAFVSGIPNGVTDFGPITADATQEVPVTLQLTSPATVLTPSANGA